MKLDSRVSTERSRVTRAEESLSIVGVAEVGVVGVAKAGEA
jgi:hypothetical protein